MNKISKKIENSQEEISSIITLFFSRLKCLSKAFHEYGIHENYLTLNE